MRKRITFDMSYRVEYTDGMTETLSGNCEFIRRRFKDLVHAAVETRLDGFKSVTLLDGANRAVKTYIQNI